MWLDTTATCSFIGYIKTKKIPPLMRPPITRVNNITLNLIMLFKKKLLNQYSAIIAEQLNKLVNFAANAALNNSEDLKVFFLFISGDQHHILNFSSFNGVNS